MVQICKTSVHIWNTIEDILNVLGEQIFNGGTEIALKNIEVQAIV